MPSSPTANSNTPLPSAPGSTHFVTVQGDQYVGPTPLRLTWPLNRAPTAGPVAPCVHLASKVSGENSPIRVTSLTRSQTFSGAAAIVSVTSRVSPLIPPPHFE